MNRRTELRIDDLSYWASQLGWGRLRVNQLSLSESDAPEREITWYEAGHSSGGRDHCALQINEEPIGQQVTYAAAVYAIRYGLYSGWHVFTVSSDRQMLLAEAVRLRPWLSRSWFATLDGRREYRRLHPECTGFTWRRLRDTGPSVQSGKRGHH
jgi:hypothetical protein